MRTSIFSLLLSLVSLILPGQTEAEYYRLTNLPIPAGIELEVGGMDFTADGRLAVCTRRGEVWMISDLDAAQPLYQRYAHGLHEPLGLTVDGEALYVAQRQELTRLSPLTPGQPARRYESVFILPLSGNYHEYHYGPLVQPDGSLLTTLNVGWHGKGTSRVPWRGWMMRYDPETEKLTPFAAGLRSPAGFGTDAAGEIFVAENQGDWVGSGRITHLREGDFAGHRASLRWADQPGSPVVLRPEDIHDDYGTMTAAAAELEGLKLPAVWFPHGIMGISTAAILTDRTGGTFGPFAGQMLVSDQGQSKIMRVSLERVNGEYQGAVFPFRAGFRSGTLRMVFGPDGALYVGQTARGWAATGGELFGLEKLEWTGRTPFEMHRVEARPDGFDLVFTRPVRTKSISKGAFQVSNFNYLYRQAYGSPVSDLRNNEVASSTLLPDGKTIRITLDDFRPGHIYEIKLKGLRAADGTDLLHDYAYYTLNTIPGGSTNTAAAEASEVAASTSAKRVTTMPAAWNGRADREIQLESAAGMKFKRVLLTVKAGAKVAFTFYNPDDMQHNFLLARPKRGDAVGRAAAELGLSGAANGYVPDSPDVIAHTRLVEPGESDVIYFTAPTEPGLYEYICTVPGHYTNMRGVLRVE